MVFFAGSLEMKPGFHINGSWQYKSVVVICMLADDVNATRRTGNYCFSTQDLNIVFLYDLISLDMVIILLQRQVIEP